MRYFFFFIFYSFCFIQVKSQNVDFKDPYHEFSAARKNKSFEKKDVFFNKEFIPAKLYTSKGLIKADNKYQLDLELNKIYFLDNVSGEEWEVKSPIKAIEFLYPDAKMISFERGFPVVDGFDQQKFYQVLVTGKAKLLLATKFEEVTINKYGAAPEKSLERTLFYYVFSNGTIEKITKPEHFSSVCADKIKEVQAFIQKENVKLKKQSDLERVVQYYNSLF
jgi:hypothetical protein